MLQSVVLDSEDNSIGAPWGWQSAGFGERLPEV